MSNYIDKIFYINLSHRTDKKQQIEEELNKFNLQYERFEGIYCKEYGPYGCGMSHLSLLIQAKERNYKNILIFEDDFTFLVSKEVFEEQLKLFFENESNKNFDVCMLSYNLHNFEEIPDNVVNKVIFAQTASGYIINSHYYDKLISLYQWALPLLLQTKIHWLYMNDIVWKNYQLENNWYYFKIRIGKQRPSISDNSGQFVDYNC